MRGRGYRSIGIDRIRIQAHRVVFAMTRGRWPIGLLDHRNRNRLDNTPSNLREATKTESARNRGLLRSNKSGRTGVSVSGNRWRATIHVDGRQINLGRFVELEDAELAYARAAQKHHGEFSALNSGATA